MEEENTDTHSVERISLKPKKHKSTAREDKRKKKLRLKYENMYKTEVLGSLRDDVDDNELELERLVFGGENDVLQQLDSKNLQEKANDSLEEEGSEAETDVAKHSEESKAPAWIDEDDEKILVSDKTSSMKNCPENLLKRADQKYEKLAREKFLKVAGEPEWANLKKKDSVDSDESEEEELLQKTGNFVLESQSLRKGTIELRKCQNLTEANSQPEIIKSVEFHRHSKVAVVAGYSGTATLYQIDGKTNAKIQSVHFKKFPIYTAHFSTDGNELVVGSKEYGHYFCYDMISGKINKVPWEKDMDQMNVQRFCMSPDGKLIVIHGRHGKMHLVSAKSKEWIQSLKMNGEVIAITFNKDGSKMYSHGQFGQVYVWDMNSRLCIHKFTDQGCITGTSITLSSNEQYLATGSDSGVVNIYDTSSVMMCREPQPLKAVMNLTTEISILKYNNTSELMAMASSLKPDAIKLVHFPSMTVFSNFPNQEKRLRYISSVDLSPNSGYLMMGNNVGKVFLYRLRHYSNY